MTVNYLIIHNLAKELQGTASLTISKNTLLSSEKKTVSLIEKLNSSYRNNITYGIFADKEGDATTFQNKFDTYLKDQKKNAFIKLSKNTVNMLHAKITSIKQARGGYLVYADYTDRGNHFFSIFLIRDKLDENFIQKDGVITIDEVIHVDTDKLAMACRINIESYQSYTQGDSGTYLGFISIKQPDTSIYFLDWIGAEKKERSTEDSRNLVKILNGIPVPQENGKAMGKDNFRKKAYDAIRSFGTSPININSLSAVLFGDDSIINAYAEENNIILNTEFVSDKKTVKRLVSYYINADGIELQFPPEYLGGKISFDTNDPSLVIIRSEKFASAIKEQDSEWKI